MAPVEDQWGVVETLINDSDQFRRYHQDGVGILKVGLDLYADGQWKEPWKLSAEDKELDAKVYVRKTDAYGNVYAVDSKINASARTILRVNWDDAAEMHKWNPSVKEFKVVSQLGSQSQLVNNASEPLLGGLVSSRDFVDVRVWRKIDNAFCVGARSVHYEQVPPQKGRVRGENKIGLFHISPADGDGASNVVWMTSLDLKGLLPKSVVERAMNSFLLEYVRHLKSHLEKNTNQ